MAGRNWKSLLIFVPAATLFAVLFGPTLFAPPGHVPAVVDSDFWLYYHPLTETTFGLLKEGHLPLWNPYLYSGMPLLASIEIGVLYPPNWLHLVISTDRAFCLLYVLHALLAAGGMWMYTRGRGRSVESALLSVMIFTFAAPTLLHLNKGMVTIVYSSSWCPLIFALVDRCLRLKTLRSALPLALALACQFLAGFPMFTLLLAVLIPAYLLVFGVDRSRGVLANLKLAVSFGIAAMLALGLVAPQMLPTFRYLDEAVRRELSYQQATHCCFPAINLLTFLMPDFLGNNHICPYWGEMFLFDANGFCGAIALLLTVITWLRWRRREVLFWTAAGCVITGIALGKDSFFYDLAYLYVPWVDRFRGVGRLMIFVNFALAILAGLGLDDALTNADGKWVARLCRIVGALSLAAFVVALIQWWAFSSSPPSYWVDIFRAVRREGGEFYTEFVGVRRDQILHNGFNLMLRSAALESVVVFAGCAAILFSARHQTARRLMGFGLLSLLGLELGVFESQFIVLNDTTPWRTVARRVKAALPQEAQPFRVAGFSQSPPLSPNRFLYENLESVGGHENFVLERYSHFLYYWAGIDPQWQTYLTVPNDGPLYDLLNVKYYVCAPEGHRQCSNGELIQSRVFQFGGRDFALYRNRNVLPRVNLVHQVHWAANRESVPKKLKRLSIGRFETDSVIEGNPSTLLTPVTDAERARESVVVSEYAPGRLVVDVECVAPGLLIFIENYFSSWQATVDGQSAPVWPANMFMMAVPVSAGRHQVILSFQSRPFEIGCLLAGLSLCIIIAGFAAPVFTRRRQSGA